MTTPLAHIAEPSAATTSWPNCPWRVLIDDSQLSCDLATCRHQRVRTPGQLVTAEICQSCTARLSESPPALNRKDRSGCCSATPSLLRKGWNAAVAVAQFVADGGWTLTPEEFRFRLEICETCDRRKNNTCTACGCNLTLKARGRAFNCPLGKWPLSQSCSP